MNALTFTEHHFGEEQAQQGTTTKNQSCFAFKSSSLPCLREAERWLGTSTWAGFCVSSELTVWGSGEWSLLPGLIWEEIDTLSSKLPLGAVYGAIAVAVCEVRQCIAETWERRISADAAMGQRFWEFQCWQGEPIGTSVASPCVF